MKAPLFRTAGKNVTLTDARDSNVLGQLTYENFRELAAPNAHEAIKRARELYFNRDRLLPF